MQFFFNTSILQSHFIKVWNQLIILIKNVKNPTFIVTFSHFVCRGSASPNFGRRKQLSYATLLYISHAENVVVAIVYKIVLTFLLVGGILGLRILFLKALDELTFRFVFTMCRDYFIFSFINSALEQRSST